MADKKTQATQQEFNYEKAYYELRTAMLNSMLASLDLANKYLDHMNKSMDERITALENEK